MAGHLDALLGLINQTISVELLLVEEVLVLMLLGSLQDSWVTLVVTLRNCWLEGKHLSLETVKSSLLSEEARRKDRESATNPKALVMDGDMNRGRGLKRSLQNQEKLRTRSKSRGRSTYFYCGKMGHF